MTCSVEGCYRKSEARTWCKMHYKHWWRYGEPLFVNNSQHGMYASRLYSIWAGMKSRCNNPANRAYKNYGGRGIKITESWNEFVPFMEWALNNGYEDTLTIDRINSNGDYEPDNCKWSTRKEQSNNLRRNILITFSGQTLTLKQWCEKQSLNYSTVRKRRTMGWDDFRALELE